MAAAMLANRRARLESAGASGASLWADAADRVGELPRHAEAKRFFWADVVGKQLRDHHVAGLTALIAQVRVADDADPGVGMESPSPMSVHESRDSTAGELTVISTTPS